MEFVDLFCDASEQVCPRLTLGLCGRSDGGLVVGVNQDLASTVGSGPVFLCDLEGQTDALEFTGVDGGSRVVSHVSTLCFLGGGADCGSTDMTTDAATVCVDVYGFRLVLYDLFVFDLRLLYVCFDERLAPATMEVQCKARCALVSGYPALGGL